MNHQTPNFSRRSIRLKEYNYSQPGAYFVTICTKGQEYSFGEIINGVIELSKLGSIVRDCWLKLLIHFKFIELDEYVVLPDHLHGIINIFGDIDKGLINQTPTNHDWIMTKDSQVTLGKVIRHFKAKSSKTIHDAGYPNFQWQRNYYEHIIRDEHELSEIRKYIISNPYDWVSENKKL